MSQYKVHRIRFVDYFPKTINAAAYDNDSRIPKLALAREDGSIEIRNPLADWLIDYVIPGHDKITVEHLVWCDGRLFSGSSSGDIIEWDLELLQPKYHQDSYGGPVWCLKFSYDKKVLAAGCEDGSIRLFDMSHDSIMYKSCLNKQEHRILCLAWSHDDKFIVTGGFDCTMNMVEVRTGHVVSRMTTNDLKSSNTMVWAMDIFDDLTIVIGDSLGNTQFWDGKTCTLLQSFKSHEADVLTLAVDKKNQVVYSSGIDSKVVQFKLVPQDEQTKWVITANVRGSKHDTRTLCLCRKPDNNLVSGGIDPRFIVYKMHDFNLPSSNRYSCLPKRNVCQVSRNLFSFREQHSVHIWRLGAVKDADNPDDKQSSDPKKLFEIKCDRPAHLVSSAMSEDSSYFAYSSILRGQLFELDVSTPGVKKSAVRIPPSTHMCFLRNSRRLVTVGIQKNIHVINVNDGDCKIIRFPENGYAQLPYTFLSVSNNDNYIVVVDSLSQAFLFSLTENEYITSLPRIDGVVTSCTFHPCKNNIFFMTHEKHIYEYNIEEEKFEQWSLELNKSNIVRCVMGSKKDKANLVINPSAPDEIFLQVKEVFGKLVCGTAAPPQLENIKNTKEKSIQAKRKRAGEIVKTSSEYNSMMFFDFNSAGDIVVVERPMNPILEKLPAPLKIKKFGS